MSSWPHISRSGATDHTYQINVDLGMSKWSSATVTNGLTSVNVLDGLVRYELHRAERVWLQLHGGLLEART